MKILIVCPFLNKLGGVANHYKGLKSYWTQDVRYLEVGNRSKINGKGFIWLPLDVIRLIISILFFKPDCVLLNPSIGMNALRRDFLFQRIANFLGAKTIVYIHGFNIPTFNNIDKKWLNENLNRSKLIFVLATDFKKRLIDNGVTTPIAITTTKVDDKLIQDFDVSSRDGRTGNLLFISRVEREKGIHEALDIFKLLSKDFPDLKFDIVGDGSELQLIKKRIEDEKINGVTILGRLDGKDLVKSYESALLLLLLTSYGEGLPTVVLEGMAFGLPIVTRPVGGLADFFEDGSMGIISESLEPDYYATKIKSIIQNPSTVKRISNYNHAYAKSHFLASSVAKRFEKTITEYLLNVANNK